MAADNLMSFHTFAILYPVLGNVSKMDTPLYIRSPKITTPLGGTCPYRYCGGFFTFIEVDQLQVFDLQEVFRFCFISCCGNSTLPTFFQISENSSVDMLFKTSCQKNCLYCSLEKYYFQSLLNGVFINKKR